MEKRETKIKYPKGGEVVLQGNAPASKAQSLLHGWANRREVVKAEELARQSRAQTGHE